MAPRLMNTNPPGNANAFMALSFTQWNSNGYCTPPVGSLEARRIPRRVRYASTLGALHDGNCLVASSAGFLPSSTSCCGENKFHPGLSCVRCAEAPGESRRDSPRKKAAPFANCGLPTETPRIQRTPARFESQQWMLTTASTIPMQDRWRSSVQGYFTTVGEEMKKCPGGLPPGRNSKANYADLASNLRQRL